MAHVFSAAAAASFSPTPLSPGVQAARHDAATRWARTVSALVALDSVCEQLASRGHAMCDAWSRLRAHVAALLAVARHEAASALPAARTQALPHATLQQACVAVLRHLVDASSSGALHLASGTARVAESADGGVHGGKEEGAAAPDPHLPFACVPVLDLCLWVSAVHVALAISFAARAWPAARPLRPATTPNTRAPPRACAGCYTAVAAQAHSLASLGCHVLAAAVCQCLCDGVEAPSPPLGRTRHPDSQATAPVTDVTAAAALQYAWRLLQVSGWSFVRPGVRCGVRGALCDHDGTCVGVASQADPNQHRQEHLALLWTPSLLELAVFLQSRRLTAAQAAVDALGTPVAPDAAPLAHAAAAAAALSTALEQLRRLGVDAQTPSKSPPVAGPVTPARGTYARALLRARLRRYLHSAISLQLQSTPA